MLRFLPDKMLFMFCSAENPRLVLQKMMGNDYLKIKGGMLGQWNFTKDNLQINAVLGTRYTTSSVFLINWAIIYSL